MSRRAPKFALLSRLIPFFLSAVLFMSGLLAIFAPLPLMDTSFRWGRAWAWAAAAVNTVLIAWLSPMGGVLAGVAVFSVFVLAPGLALPESLKAGLSPGRAGVLTLCLMVATLLAWISAGAAAQGVAPWVAAKTETSQLLDQLYQSIPAESRSQWLGDLTPEDWKHGLMVEFPSALIVAMLLICWANLMLLLRLNPSRIRARLRLEWSYFKGWHAPEWLLWPTIIAGAVVVFMDGTAGDFALNFFKVFMAIYALQGLSVLSSLFDAWKVRGLWRSLGYFLIVLLMMPLLLGIGFFDTWFDFRSKLRQS